MKTAYRTNIYASIAFDDLFIRRYTARYETTSSVLFLFTEKEQNNVFIKRFNTDTLVSVKLKRTIMSYLKYR